MNKNQNGFAHLAVVVIVVLLAVVIGTGFIVYNKRSKQNDAVSTQSSDNQASGLQLNSEQADEIITVPSVDDEDSEAPKTDQPVENTPSSPAPDKGPNLVRIALYNGKSLDISLKKGGGDGGYYTPECSKGGDEVLPIVTVASEVPDIRVRLCSNHILPTSQPKSNVARLTLANGDFIDTSLSKGGDGNGYQPASNCQKGGGGPNMIVKIQTPIDIRKVELCGEHKLHGSAI